MFGMLLLYLNHWASTFVLGHFGPSGWIIHSYLACILAKGKTANIHMNSGYQDLECYGNSKTFSLPAGIKFKMAFMLKKKLLDVIVIIASHFGILNLISGNWGESHCWHFHRNTGKGAKSQTSVMVQSNSHPDVELEKLTRHTQ